MRTDMSKDVFADTPMGRLALQKLAPVPPNFRLYEVEILGDPRERRNTATKFTGAEFRVARSGPNKGLFTVMVSGTKRSTYCTTAELEAAK